MTFYYNNVYLDEVSTVCGPYEKNGPLRKYFDKTFDDFYFGEKSFEKGEIRSIRLALIMLMKKSGYKKDEFDLVIGGDLLNQIVATTYGTCGIGKSFIGVYGACSSSVLSMIIGANFIEQGIINNCVSIVSSNNLASEKQFRFPTEYGGCLKPPTATFTSSGAACCLLTKSKSDIKITCATLGKIIDYSQNDPNDMGRCMAPALIDTLVNHFKDTGRNPDYYDLILSGDLGKYGKEIVKDYLNTKYNINITNNYNDCGVMLYDLDVQREVKAGGSGPVCSALVVYSYIVYLMRRKKLNKVLFLATGALFSPIMLFQKENINSICHAISMEVV